MKQIEEEGKKNKKEDGGTKNEAQGNLTVGSKPGQTGCIICIKCCMYI